MPVSVGQFLKNFASTKFLRIFLYYLKNWTLAPKTNAFFYFSAWLITTLVVLLIYLCTRCCDTKSTKHRKSRPIRCLLSFFALVTAAGLAGGFWGNHVLHGGVTEFEKATENIVNIVRRIQEMSRVYNEVLQKDIEQNMNKLYDGPFQRDIRESPSSHLEIMDNSDFIFFNISEGLKGMDEIRFTVSDPNNRIDLRFLPFWASTVERYRWPITMALQSKYPFATI